MAIRVEERFTVKAPPEAVWSYLVDPRRVVTCLPGAELVEVVDERTFDGRVKVKVGTVVVAYRGRIRLEEVDPVARRVKMIGEGRESTGAGSARMTMSSTVSPAGEGAEVLVHADLEVVGRIVQLGRGMVEQVSHQIFGEFSACVRATLEAQAVPGAAGAPAPRRQEAVAALPLLFRALWAWILSLLGLKRGERPGGGRA
jgi:carbon monoxide dehydrogenase subunit G